MSQRSGVSPEPGAPRGEAPGYGLRMNAGGPRNPNDVRL